MSTHIVGADNPTLLLFENLLGRALAIDGTSSVDFMDHVDSLILLHEEEIHLILRRLSLLDGLLFHHSVELPGIVLIKRSCSYFIVVDRGCPMNRVEAHRTNLAFLDDIALPFHCIDAPLFIAASIYVIALFIFVWDHCP